MPILPNPHRCIWCLKTSAEVIFDESHVLPNCVGNDKQQVLPSGIVCKRWHGFFGTQIEPALLRDPVFHVGSVFLSIVDPQDMNVFRDKIFDAEHQSTSPVNRELNLHLNVKPAEITLDVRYAISGQHQRTYKPNDLKKLSRAIHKIAFESLAYLMFVQGHQDPVDLFSAEFDAVRRWGKEGQPQNTVRPVLRRPAPKITANWAVDTARLGRQIRVLLDLFGDWYGVNLTASQNEIVEDLRLWGARLDNVWFIGETMGKL